MIANMLETKYISLNLRRLRKAKGLTQERVAEQSGLSRAAYRNIEMGASTPRVANLQAIASSLGVSIRDLVTPVRQLRVVRFRSKSKLRDREQILVDVGRWLADFCELEQLLGDYNESRLDCIRNQLESAENRAKSAAALARNILGIAPASPIRDICGLLESAGVKVGERKLASHDFFGLSVCADDGGPAVVVNTWSRISVERWIFTAAHELGHLILHFSDYDVRETELDKDQENEANLFASAFLMPDSSFHEKWEQSRGLAFVDRVLTVKRIFGVSYLTVLYRLSQDYPELDNVWVRFKAEYKRRTGRKLFLEDEPDALKHDAFRTSLLEYHCAAEPFGLSKQDFVHGRLFRLVRMAIEQEKISLGRGAEILEISLASMRELSASWIG